MTHNYIGTKEIVAWPSNRELADKEGSGVAIEEGYAVKYPDGYISWSPKAAFEASYRLAEGEGQKLTYGDALHFLKLGKRVSRVGWNGKGMWLEMQHPDAHSKMTLPYIFMRTAQGDNVPWLCSQTDGIAEDWSAL